MTSIGNLIENPCIYNIFFLWW